MFEKIVLWLLKVVLSPKNIRRVLKVIAEIGIKNIKNDGKVNWMDTALLPVLESLVKGLDGK